MEKEREGGRERERQREKIMEVRVPLTLICEYCSLGERESVREEGQKKETVDMQAWALPFLYRNVYLIVPNAFRMVGKGHVPLAGWGGRG